MKIHEITSENDIGYRGALSYRHLRIIGWICFALGEIGMFMSIAMKINEALPASYPVFIYIFDFIYGLAMPCFLLANFSIILNAKDAYKKLLIRFGALTAAVFAVFFLFFGHYAMGIGTAYLGGRAETLEFVDMLLQSSGGYVAFNFFLDLLLCTLFMFFLNYEPKKVFVGKKLIIFRLFSILPILYEALSIILKVLSSVGKIKLSIYLCPFLTTKPPVMFVVFIVLALFLKRRERKFIKNGKTKEDYAEFLGTNANSLRFSIFTAVSFVIAAIVDLILLIVISAVVAGAGGYDESQFVAVMATVTNWGFGESLMLLVLAPVVMLFSYTRVPKNQKYDIFVPIGGALLLILVFLEGTYRIICMLPEVMTDILSSLS